MTFASQSRLTRRAGSAPGEDDVSGTITVPEVAHDTEEDEYVVCLPPLPHMHLCSRSK